jgi:hypothetical protein
MKMISSASNPGSSSIASRHARYSAGPALAIISTGFVTDAARGNAARNLACVPSLSFGTSNPAASAASTAMIAGPPALVRMPILLPAGIGCVASKRATAKNSASVSTRMMPVCANSASAARSELASAAVWLEAARAPPAVRPDFTATTGLRRETRRAIREKRRGLPKPSR